jgi:hypothetical protein
MSYFSDRLFHHTNVPVVQAEKTGMGPKINIGARTGIKADRLVGQVFACESGQSEGRCLLEMLIVLSC